MHIPTITDEMFEKVVGTAASPVVVFFEVAGSAPCAKARKELEVLSEEYDDRVIFIRISVDENPIVCGKQGIEAPNCPAVVAYKRKKVIGSLKGTVDTAELDKLLEQAISAT